MGNSARTVKSPGRRVGQSQPLTPSGWVGARLVVAFQGTRVDALVAAIAVAADLRGLGRSGLHLVEHGDLVGLIAELVVVALIDVDQLTLAQNDVLALV